MRLQVKANHTAFMLIPEECTVWLEPTATTREAYRASRVPMPTLSVSAQQYATRMRKVP